MIVSSSVISETTCPTWWNEYLLKNPDSTSYQISSFVDIYKKSFNSKPIFLYVQNNKNIDAQFCGLIHKDFSWRDSNFSNILSKSDLGTHIQWFYGPIIHNKNLETTIMESILVSLDDIASSSNVSFIRGLSPPNSSFKEIFLKHGYSVQPWSTYIVNLNQNYKELYDSFDKKTRYDIRKADNLDLVFTECKNSDDFQKYLDLKLNSKEKLNQQIKKKSTFYENLWKFSSNDQSSKTFLVKHNGDVVAAMMCLTFNKNLIQYGVVTSEKNPLSGTYLTWNVIKWGISNKFNTFDLGGVNPDPVDEKEKNIAYFKAKWNGEKSFYEIYTKIIHNTKYKIGKILGNPKLILKNLK